MVVSIKLNAVVRRNQKDKYIHLSPFFCLETKEAKIQGCGGYA